MERFSRKKTGFSLLEAIIGFCILSSAAIVFFQTVHMFKKETVFYSEHLIAASLQEKIVEQCFQETEINPHGLESLGMADAADDTFKLSTYITDGQTVFFKQPVIDEQNFKSLFEVVNNNFKLGLSTQRQPGLYEVGASFDWSARYGKGNARSFCKVLSVTGKKEVFTSLDLSNLAVEERILQEIFSVADTSVTSLNETLPSIGAQNLVMNIAHIHYACSDLISSTEFLDRCKLARQLETGFSVDSQDYEKCSGMFFDIARDMLHLMMRLQPRIKVINENLGFINQIPLANQATVKTHLTKAAYFYQQVRNVFLASALKLISRYEQQMGYCFNLREQRTIAARIFNLYRIVFLNAAFCKEVITSDSPELRIKNKYFNFIKTIQAYFSDRDPALERMATQEKVFAENNQLKQKHFIPGLINDLFLDIDALFATAQALEEESS